jgi:CMP-N,N'-diacetyllegionaminic acid synthase
VKIITVVPARGNSKSIPLKNLSKLNQKPLIYYSIKHSLKCKMIDRTIVSTDNKLIAKVSKKYGAEVPFLRPKNLSKDSSKDIGFFKHLLSWLKKNENYRPDLIIQLRPTNPLRNQKLISEAIKLMKKYKNADSLRSISVPERSPYKMWVKKGKYLEYFMKNKSNKKDYFNMDRRKLPKIFWHDGVIDIVRSETIENHKDLIGDKIIYIENRFPYLIDIDSPQDLKIANLLVKSGEIKL